MQVKGEQCVVLRLREGSNPGKVVLTNPDEIGLKEWSLSLRTALKHSHELLSGLKKAGKIYGTAPDHAAADRDRSGSDAASSTAAAAATASSAPTPSKNTNSSAN